MAQSDHIDAMTLRDYWRVVWLRRYWVIAIVVVCTSVAFGRQIVQSPTYVATAQLMYSPPPTLSNGVVVSPDLSRLSFEVQNVVSTVGTPAVRQRAAKALGRDATVSYSISATPAVPSSSSSATGTGVQTVVDITAEAGSPAVAARVANAYAQTIIQLRKETQQQSWRTAEQIVQLSLDSQSKQSPDYATLQQQLRNLQIAEASATGDFEIIVPATPPASPASPKPLKWALFGFVAGLFLGVVAAFVVNQFDTHVRSPEAAAGLLKMPLLAQLGKISAKSLDREPLYVLGAPSGPPAEAIRKLRANLEFSNVDGELRSLFLTSAWQGEGKTTLACNLSVALAEAGSKVVLVDGDLRRPRVHTYFGLKNALGVSSVLTGKTTLEDTLRPVLVGRRSATAGDVRGPAHGQHKLSVLTSGLVPPNPGEIIASNRFRELIARLQSEFDIVMVDAPALLPVGDAATMARFVDGLVFLVNLDKARRSSLHAAASQVSQMPCRKLGVVTIGKLSELGYGHGYYGQYTRGERDELAASRVTVLGSGEASYE